MGNLSRNWVNIAPDLSGFNNIVPYGIKEFGVTSFADLGISFDENLEEILKEKIFRTYLEFLLKLIFAELFLNQNFN